MAVGSLKRSSIAAYTKYDSMLAGNTFTPTTFDYELLATTVLSSSQASVTFTLPSNAATEYKHLQIRYTGRSNRVDTDSILGVTFNGATGTYRSHYLYGNGTSTVSADYSGVTIRTYAGLAGANLTAGTFASGVIDILDFASSSKNKTTRTLVGISHSSYPRVALLSGAWFSTAAITSITLTDEFSTMIAGSRFSIYGVKG